MFLKNSVVTKCEGLSIFIELFLFCGFIDPYISDKSVYILNPGTPKTIDILYASQNANPIIPKTIATIIFRIRNIL